MIIFLVLFSLLSFHFIFIFYSPTSFTFTLPILFDLYYICCFISCLFYCIYYHFISLFIPHNPLSQKCRVKTNRCIHFSSRHIWKQVLLFLFLFWLLLFKETCFKFYLIAVLICYLHFIIHCRAHMPLEHWSSVFPGQASCKLPWTWQEMRPGLLQKHYALCDGVLVCIQLSTSLVLLILNFFSPLFF